MHDLVQLDQQTAGVIFKTEHNQFKVIDQNGLVRTVGPRQISMRRDSRRAVATDSENHDIRIGDMVKEIEGEQRKGQVLHIHRSVFIFLYNREINENNGVFITRSTLLASVAPKTLNNSSVDLSQMNPAMNSVNPIKEKGGMVGSQMMGKGMRDKLADIPVQIIRGSYKGMIGVVKGTNGNQIRIELTTNSKIISLEKEMCMRRHNNQLVSLDTYVGPPRNQNTGDRNTREGPYISGSATPNNMGSATPWQGGGKTPFGQGGATPWGGGGRTPASGGRTPAAGAWAAGSKTPGWGAGARTPAAGAWSAGSKTPGARGGATPGWGAGSKTPGWGAGSKTPGWGAGSKTPMGAWGAGSKTPGGANWGASTPAVRTQDSSDQGWGSISPNRGAQSNQEWASSKDSSNEVSPVRQQSVNFGSVSPQPTNHQNWDSQDDVSEIYSISYIEANAEIISTQHRHHTEEHQHRMDQHLHPMEVHLHLVERQHLEDIIIIRQDIVHQHLEAGRHQHHMEHQHQQWEPQRLMIQVQDHKYMHQECKLDMDHQMIGIGIMLV